MADAKITTVFRIEGQDGASAAVNSVRGSVQKLGPVLSGVGSLASSEFSKLGQGATLAAGAMNLIPGPLGMVASLAVGAGAAIWALTRNTESLADAQLKSLQIATAMPKLLAERYGVEASLLALQEKELFNAADLAARLKSAAEAEKAMLDARKSGEKAVADEAAIRFSTIKAEAIVMQEQVDLSNKRLASELKIRSMSFKYSEDIADAEAQAAVTMNKRDQIEQKRAIVVAKEKELRAKLVELREADAVGAEAVAEKERQQHDLRRRVVLLSLEEQAIASESAKSESKRAGSARGLLDTKQKLAALAKEDIEVQKALNAFAGSAARQQAKDDAVAAASANVAKQAQNDLAAAKAAAAMAGAEGGLGPIERAEIERQRIVDLDAAKATYANNEIARIAAIETANVNADAKRAASLRKESEAAKKLAADDKQRWLDRGDAAIGFGQLAVQGLQMAGASEKALALVKGGFAIAEGLLSFVKLYPTNPAGAYLALAAGGMAAVAFGVGAFSTPTAAGGGGAVGGYGSAPGTAASAAQATGPANITIVLQGGAVMGTAQQVGAYINKAIGSLSGTGLVATAGV